MKNSLLLKALSLLVVASFVLAACGAPAATEAPAVVTDVPATDAPAVTEAPTDPTEINELDTPHLSPDTVLRRKTCKDGATTGSKLSRHFSALIFQN